MTRYVFTGPSQLTEAQREAALAVVASLREPSEITTGAAAGWDMAVAFAAIEAWPQAHHRVVCPGAPYDGHSLDRLIRRAGELRLPLFTVISMPPQRTTSETYRARNEAMLDHGDVLVAAVRSLVYYRSGEWMTANVAKKRGLPIEFVDFADLT